MPSTGPETNPGAARGRIHVVAAALLDSTARQVLIARRDPRAHQGGLWEFPGGKVEPGESAEMALRRELHEEIGIHATRLRPLISVAHDYADKRVLLDTWQVDAYSGEPEAREGQPLRWVPIGALRDFEFPAANRPIIDALQLPGCLPVVEASGADAGGLLRRLSEVCERPGVDLLQLHAGADVGPALLTDAMAMCRERGKQLMLDARAEGARAMGADGLHFSIAQLDHGTPPRAGRWLSAGCRDARELDVAMRAGVDFVLISPADDGGAFDWEAFARLARLSNLPAYAFGDLDAAHGDRARWCAGQGTAVRYRVSTT